MAAAAGTMEGWRGRWLVEALPASSCTGIEYKGDDPDVLIASDLPLQGSSRTQTIQIVGAIRYLLDQQNWKAGDYNVAFQSCDDSTAQAGKWDSGKCSQNAQAYPRTTVVAVIGTFNSGCAQIIPVLNQAPNGGIAMMSPANTAVCIEGGPGCENTEPDKYYPAGNRNYARVAPHDAYQGAAMAEFMREGRQERLHPQRQGVTASASRQPPQRRRALGIKVAGFEAWDPKAASYEGLFRKIGGSGADAVFLGGLIDENGAKVIKDKVAVLGPNDGKVKLYAPDGFTTQQTIDEAGKAAAGMYLSSPASRSTSSPARARSSRTRSRAPRRQADRPVRDLRRAGGADRARRDRGVRRLALGHHRQDVRHERHRRPDRQLRDQRERRSRPSRWGGRRLHDLQGDDEARGGEDALSEARERRGSARHVGAATA